jgi:hypothetical protein
MFSPHPPHPPLTSEKLYMGLLNSEKFFFASPPHFFLCGTSLIAIDEEQKSIEG